MEENLNQIEPPAELLNKVFVRLKYEQKKARIKIFVLFSVGILGSVFVFIPMLIGTIAEIRQSGFANIFSLVFSDFQAVIMVWDDFLMSLLETLPIIHFAILFASVYIFLRTIKYFAKNIYSERVVLQVLQTVK
jgi:hypothetical protein